MVNAVGGSAARRGGAAVLPCALGTPPSLVDGSPSRAHALLAWHEEAALGCALVAVYHDLYPTSKPPFLLPQYVATRRYRMPPKEVLRIFRALFTREDFEDLIRAHDEEMGDPWLPSTCALATPVCPVSAGRSPPYSNGRIIHPPS
jgi:hypothetical protein